MAEKKNPVYYRPGEPMRKNFRTKKKSLFKTLFKVFFALLFIMLLVAGGATAAVVIHYVNETPPFDPSRLATVETSYLYDARGDEVTILHEEQNRIAVGIDDVPEHVKQAFIAIEDERFFDHFGFDMTGSMRAAYANFQAGDIVQGGSTITQQLAQNAFLTTEKTYRRKVQEIWLAIQLERNYSKQEVLQLYLNRIYFGNSAYGVEAAAQTYFDKHVTELNLAEAAMLAGIVRSPNNYNPIDNERKARDRMHTVLANMKRLGQVSEFQYNRAMKQDFFYAELRDPEYPYPYYIDYVVHHELIRILSAIPSIGSREKAYQAIYKGGLRIYTNLDPDMQKHVEEVLGRQDLYPSTIYVDMPAAKRAISELPPGQDLPWEKLQEFIDEENGLAQPQAAIVVADPNTGKVIAMGGGREYRKDHDEVLRFNTLRQPGSAIKPIIAYGPAFEEGTLAGAGSTINDAPFTGPQGWQPTNFDRRFRGMISARDALYYSYNIPAIRAFVDLGPRVGADYAQRMGINSIVPEEVDNLALSLGGFTYGVSALDMAQAYGVLANGGVRVDLHTVERIEDRHGRVIFEQAVDPRQVLSPQAAFLVNDILQDFVRKHLGRALQIDRAVAAKTGTTDRFKDVNLAAYTPNLVATFWMGYDEPKMGSIRDGWRYSTAFLREVFLEAFKDLEIRDFNRPEGIVRMEVCTVSGLRPTETCRVLNSVRTDYFIEKHAPRSTCDRHLFAEREGPEEDERDHRSGDRSEPDRDDGREEDSGDENGSGDGADGPGDSDSGENSDSEQDGDDEQQQDPEEPEPEEPGESDQSSGSEDSEEQDPAGGEDEDDNDTDWWRQDSRNRD